MFVRKLVSGVRSSCPASAARRRCARCDSSSASSIALKLPASRPTSSLPVVSIRRDRSRVSATSSTAEVSRRTGRSAARATMKPRTAATSTPTSAVTSNASPMSLTTALVSVSGRATWSAMFRLNRVV
jgi:hypothetical protein